MATEFCGTSISSQGPPQKDIDGWLKYNPHIHYANSRDRGYVTVSLHKTKADVTLRAIESEKVSDSKIRDLAQYVVEKGRPGAQKV